MTPVKISIAAAIASLLLILIVLELIRGRRLKERYALMWLVTGVALLILSSMTAALKVHLPLTTSGSTMSVSYAVDFASLLLLGPHETMLVAAASAFSQCVLNSKERNPVHRTLFSVASLVITVQASGLERTVTEGADSVNAAGAALSA